MSNGIKKCWPRSVYMREVMELSGRAVGVSTWWQGGMKTWSSKALWRPLQCRDVKARELWSSEGALPVYRYGGMKGLRSLAVAVDVATRRHGGIVLKVCHTSGDVKAWRRGNLEVHKM